MILIQIIVLMPRQLSLTFSNPVLHQQLDFTLVSFLQVLVGQNSVIFTKNQGSRVQQQIPAFSDSATRCSE